MSKKKDEESKHAYLMTDAEAHRIRVLADAEAEATKASSQVALAMVQAK